MPRGKPKTTPKNLGGAPNQYKEEYIKKVDEYLAKSKDERHEFHKTRGEKSDSYERYVSVNLPSIEDYARYIGKHKTTVYDWQKLHPEFAYALEAISDEQKKRLINNGLSGVYNTGLANMLLSSNHGMNQKTEVDQAITIVVKSYKDE